MKINIVILVLLLSCLVNSCGLNKSIYSEQSIIDIEDVDSIKITKAGSTVKLLNTKQSKDLTDRWNNAKSVGPCKFISIYSIEIYSKKDSIRSFRVNGSIMKEKNDWGFDLKDPNFIPNIWNSLN